MHCPTIALVLACALAVATAEHSDNTGHGYITTPDGSYAVPVQSPYTRLPPSGGGQYHTGTTTGPPGGADYATITTATGNSGGSTYDFGCCCLHTALIYANTSGVWLGVRHGPVLRDDCAASRRGVRTHWQPQTCGEIEDDYCRSAAFEA